MRCPAALVFPLFAAALALQPLQGIADETEAEYGATTSLVERVAGEVELRPRILTFGTMQDTALTGPEAARIDLRSLRAETDLRLDAEWRSDRLDVLLKPRLDVFHEEWKTGDRAGANDRDADLYLHEWLVRLHLPSDLAIAYGRENMQWGPSYLLSPSNPFLAENGKNSPKTEVRAAEYAMLHWTPPGRFAAEAIAHTDPGRRSEPYEPFDPAYALKLDWTFYGRQLGLIASRREAEDPRAGFYTTWNLNDALLQYNEAGFTSGDAEWLSGLTCTFANGNSVSAEYFYNQSGESDGDYRNALPPAEDASNREVFFRRHYVLLQFTDPMINDNLDLTLRYILNADDTSGAGLLLADYALTDRATAFLHSTLFSGDQDTEFGYLLEHRIQFGVEYAF
ncbi:hypothetical protein [Kiritimatiella glycovorans]|uniref:Phosphate-selective porin O and P n=1 Tax=Kiritimatiella glycovorans TaxID=1307763 RepID=A0A0G3EI50_9BACT|nr:hypothetical protein [Kiritimatiella glycovorans]AKJ65117.1 hypothetical protein L21SP4_01881 [Kiritimatiella glycovorans]